MDEVGRKDDAGKRRWDLLPIRSLGVVVDVLTYGAKKYTPGGWRQVPEAHDRYLAAGYRHLTSWHAGERCDPESGIHHLAHAACCFLFLVELDS